MAMEDKEAVVEVEELCEAKVTAGSRAAGF